MAPLVTVRDLTGQLRESGDAPALIALDDQRIDVSSFSAVADAVEKLASGLVAAGMGTGTPVGIYADGGPDWIMAFLAIVTAGGVAVPFDTSLKGAALAEQVRDSGCWRFFVTAQQVNDLREIDTVDVETLCLLGDETGDGASEIMPWHKLATSPVAPLPALEDHNLAALFYTSGTTGKPKGVPLSHKNLVANINSLVAEHMVGSDDRVLLPMPLHHVYPLVVGALAPLASGAAVIFPTGISGPQIVDALHRGEASVLIGVPRLYASLIEAIEARINNLAGFAQASIRAIWRLQKIVPEGARRFIGRIVFRRLRSAIGPRLWLLASGGASLDVDIWCALERFGWTVLTGYGLTETAPILTFNELKRSKIGSTGRPLADVELRIANEGKDGIGEIEARGPNVFDGYLGRPQETAAAFTADGWLRTGDLGRLDSEGYLYVVGRSKELIVLPDGKNVFPETVETAYSSSPLIRELAVLEQAGGLVGLVVPDLDELRNRGAESVAQLVRDEIRDLSSSLPSYQRLTGHVLTRTALPRTAIGKLRRHQLPNLYREASTKRTVPGPALSPADKALISTPVAPGLWDWLRRRFSDTRLTPDTSPQLDLGVDSLGWMGLSLEIEDRFGLTLSDEQIARIITLHDLVHELEKAAATASDGHDLSPELTGFLAPPTLLQRILGTALYGLFWLAMRVLFRLEIVGQKNIPVRGPCIITPNHASWLDPIVIAASLSYAQAYQVRFAGWTGLLFDNVISRTFSWAARVFPVDPDSAAASSLALARAVLDRGNILVWFPEGRRTRTGALQPFQPGIGALIQGTEIPVVPAYITGSYDAAPTGRKVPRFFRLKVTFGTPQVAKNLIKTRDENETTQSISNALHEVVSSLRE